MAKQYKNYVNGEWKTSENSITIYAPANGEELGSVPAMSQAEVDEVYAAAKAALPAWRALSYAERAAYLHKAADILERDAEKIGQVLSKEISKGLKSAIGEVVRTAEIIHYAAEEGLRLEGEVLEGGAFDATTRDLTEYARNAHNTSPVVTPALGRTMTAAVMMGSMLKGDKELLTVKIQGDGPIGSLTVTADSHGHVKGYAQNPVVLIQANSIGKLDVAGAIGKGVLSVIKDIGLKDPYVGQTDLVSGEIAEDLTYYFAVSEQTPSSVGLGVLMNKDNTVRQAGGFIIQLMPDASEETISALEKRLAKVSSVTAMLDSGKTPEDILQELLGDMELAVLDRLAVSFKCGCSKERFARGIASIKKSDIQEMIDAGENIETCCQFCNSKYVFTPDELKEMM